MSDMVDRILAYVTQEEDRYYDLGIKAMNENNPVGNAVCVAQASAFQRVRYYIEIIREEEKDLERSRENTNNDGEARTNLEA